MRYLIASIAIVTVLAGCVNVSTILARRDTQSLCVDYAQSVITGEAVSIRGPFGPDATGEQIANVLAARGAKCSPRRLYYRLAVIRIREQQNQNASLLNLAERCAATAGPTPLPDGACGYVNGVWVCEPPPCGANP
jgi:hypothetical protein